MSDLIGFIKQWGPIVGPLMFQTFRELRELDSSYRFPKQLHEREMNNNTALHEEEVKLAIDQHKSEQILNKQLFFMQTYAEFQRHAVQLDADLVNAQKEAERDMYDQRNHQLQTLVVSVTVMFSALSTVIVEGNLPSDSGYFVTSMFAISNGVSFAFLFICLVLCIELLILTSRFMVNKAKTRFRKQHDARVIFQQENEKFRKLYVDQIQINGNGVKAPLNDPNWGRDIELASDDLLQKRRDINGSFISRQKETFEFFWDNYCEFEADWAIYCFYLGTGFMLVSILVYMYVVFSSDYNNAFGGTFGCILISMSLLIGIALAFKTQKIYAGEQKVKVRLDDLESGSISQLMYADEMKEEEIVEQMGICNRIRQYFKSENNTKWKNAEILKVHEDGRKPTFQVKIIDDQSGSCQIRDDIPLSDIKLMKQNAIVEGLRKVNKGIRRATEKRLSGGKRERRNSSPYATSSTNSNIQMSSFKSQFKSPYEHTILQL